MEARVNIPARLLHVPWVQDIMKENPTTVPERYVRDDLEPVIMGACSGLQLPVIDLGRLVSEDCAKLELKKLHHACKDWGFFQLINHEVSPKLIEKVKKGTEELFNMPMEEKKKFWQRDGESSGFGQAFVFSEDQKLDWADIFYMFTLPASMRKPHLFPKLPLPFRDDLDAYSKETKTLAIKLLYLMAKALGMEAKDLEGIFEDGLQSMRMNYYPPCPQPELVMGLNSHSDGDAVTILLQVNEMEGLQIRKDGKWVPVKPLPGAFIINVGDVVEQIITNGIYQSIEHRATVNAVKERISIATFFSPRMDAEIGPASSLITSETPAMFRRITAAEHLKGYLSRELNGKAYLDAMRVQNNET
ncbi:protein SRG1-like isoform X1 [Eucalyptus grandis]|uniref:protein SRG1-like isoform X1 n=1 Tax=Eucalyptus grandis TaxID=71139 RepID=UPI00192EE4EC|nr:protein SRG1-like isoform X1 [Eucalyptus grandis]